MTKSSRTIALDLDDLAFEVAPARAPSRPVFPTEELDLDDIESSALPTRAAFEPDPDAATRVARDDEGSGVQTVARLPIEMLARDQSAAKTIARLKRALHEVRDEWEQRRIFAELAEVYHAIGDPSEAEYYARRAGMSPAQRPRGHHFW